MEELEIIRLLDENNDGLRLEDIIEVSGYKGDVVKNIINKLFNLGIIINDNDRYHFVHERFHLGRIVNTKDGLKLRTKDNKVVRVNNLLYEQKSGDYVVYTTNKKMKYDIVYKINYLKKEFGEIVKIDDIFYINTKDKIIPVFDNRVMEGNIVEFIDNGEVSITNIVGHSDEPGIEMKKLALEFGISIDYSDELKEEVKNIPMEVTEEEKSSVVDLRCDDAYTIDSIDTNDIDDALFYVGRNLNNHHVVRVYIADVNHYVKKNSESDLHARRETSSAYTPDGKAFHMLHPVYSNGICSLNPNVDRLVRVFECAVDDKGYLILDESRTYRAVINSKMKMNKDDVNRVLSGEVITSYLPFEKNLKKLNLIANLIRCRRIKNGASEFPSTELDIKFNEKNEVVKINRKKTTVADDLIEDLMLLAGEYLASDFKRRGIRGLFRVEEAPDAEKIGKELESLELLGVHIEEKTDYNSKDIQDILKKIENEPFYKVFATRLIRCMPKAHYSTVNIGHFALATPIYVQTTAPIRRDGDRINHELAYKYIDDNRIQPLSEIAKLEAHAKHLNRKEKMIQKFEIEADRYFNALYMKQFIGKEFDARIFDFAKDGIELLFSNMTEGFIKYNSLESKFDLFGHAIEIHLFNQNALLRLGDKVKVVLLESDTEKRKVIYKLNEKVLKYKK